MDTLIYSMGGGKMNDPRMAYHYRRIVDLSRAQFRLHKPHVAIIPTACFNGTHPKIGRRNIDFTVRTFRALGCDTQQILLGNVPAGQSETRNDDAQDILHKSHAVFVLGGDTRYLLEVVRDKGLVRTFELTLQDGKVMAGTSAGFIWLTDHCMSDAQSFHSEEWRYVMLQGLGILPVAGNAHDNGPIPEGLIPQKSRREQFEGHFAQLGDLPGIVIDEFAAIEVRNCMCQPRSPDPTTGAYVLANGTNGIARRKIDPGMKVDLRNAAGLRAFALSSPGYNPGGPATDISKPQDT